MLYSHLSTHYKVILERFAMSYRNTFNFNWTVITFYTVFRFIYFCLVWEGIRWELRDLEQDASVAMAIKK